MLIGLLAEKHAWNGPLLTDAETGESISTAEFTGGYRVIKKYFAASRRTAVLMENSSGYVATFFALFDSGTVICPLNTGLNRQKAAYMVRHSGCDCLVTTKTMLVANRWIKRLPCRTVAIEDVLSGAAARLRPVSFPLRDEGRDAGAKLVMYTSGTTGAPKAVMLTKKAVLAKISSLCLRLHFRKGSRFFSFLPFYSGHGLLPGLLAPLLSGCRMYLGSFNAFTALKFWEIIEKNGINYFTSVPPVLLALKKTARKAGRAKLPLSGIFSASAPLPQGTADWYLKRFGIRIRNCYGLTETASWICVPGREGCNDSPDCVGRPFNAEVIIAGRSGEKLKQMEKGEILVKSPGNMTGYYRNKKDTDEAFRDGYLKTGDLGYFDGRGRLHLSGRLKNTVKRNGINIYPAEVDQAFSSHGSVLEAATFGVADRMRGERLVSALSVSNGRDRDGYLQFAARKLPVFLLPDDLFFVDSLPRTPAGKTDLEELKRIYKGLAVRRSGGNKKPCR